MAATDRNIELELREEIKPREIIHLSTLLRRMGFRHDSTTRRTSVMSFGRVTIKGYRGKSGSTTHADVRCRVTNGQAEIVCKTSRTGSVHDRREVGMEIPLKDLYRLAPVIASLGFYSKVGSKDTENYRRGPVVVSLVQSPSGLAYIEIEKMTDRRHQAADMRRLREVAKALGVKLWKTTRDFDRFCDRLTRRDDWRFYGTPADVKRLQGEIRKVRSDG